MVHWCHLLLPTLVLLVCSFSVDLGLFCEVVLTTADEKAKEGVKPENNHYVNLQVVWGRVLLGYS